MLTLMVGLEISPVEGRLRRDDYSTNGHHTVLRRRHNYHREPDRD